MKGLQGRLPSVPLLNSDGSINNKNVVSYTVHKGRAISIDDAYVSTDFDFSGTMDFGKLTGYKSHSSLTVPLKSRGGEVIGALQLINRKNEKTGQIEPFSDDINTLVRALAAQAARALHNHELLTDQDSMLNSLIRKNNYFSHDSNKSDF